MLLTSRIQWIHLHLIKVGLAEYEDFYYLVEKDIQNMAEAFSKQMVVQGCITFGLSLIKRFTGLRIVSMPTMIPIV